MNNKQFNIAEALQTISKLELLLKMNEIYDVRDLDEISKILWKKWNEETKRA